MGGHQLQDPGSGPARSSGKDISCPDPIPIPCRSQGAAGGVGSSPLPCSSDSFVQSCCAFPKLPPALPGCAGSRWKQDLELEPPAVEHTLQGCPSPCRAVPPPCRSVFPNPGGSVSHPAQIGTGGSDMSLGLEAKTGGGPLKALSALSKHCPPPPGVRGVHLVPSRPRNREITAASLHAALC